MDVIPDVGAKGSRKRELVLAGGAVLVLGSLFILWRKHRAGTVSASSAATDPAAYTYPQVDPNGGAVGQAGALDQGTVNSLFQQNQEELRLLGFLPDAFGALSDTLTSNQAAVSGQLGDIAGSLANNASKGNPGATQPSDLPTQGTASPTTPYHEAAPLPWHKPLPTSPVPAQVAPAPKMTDQLRWSGAIDDKSRATLAAGGRVTRGNGYVYQMSGANGTGVPVRVA